MRVLAPFFAILASITTMGAAVVRLWWSKPRTVKRDDDWTGTTFVQTEPRAPSWLRRAAAVWLWVVLVGGTALVLVITILVLIDLST